MNFQERLRLLRKERKETQVQTASAIGLADRHYQRFEAGANLPSFQNLVNLAEHFQVNLDYLVGRTDVREMLPPPEES
ncbi:MAG: helix-turn-helix transcriptional regulator [Oscillibacter sp.]|nr:helix-turn-helix transcriptional regulator [Oscillibacter sp.]